MEKKIGDTFAIILTGFILVSIVMSLFQLLFRDGRGLGLMGTRGTFYYTFE